MSASEATRFIEALQADETFSAKLESMSQNPNAVFAEIKSRGFDCTAEEIKAELSGQFDEKISENDLMQIAGGVNKKTDTAKFVVSSAAAAAAI